MNEEFEERGKISATCKGFWKMGPHGSTSHCQGSCVANTTLQMFIHLDPLDFLSLSFPHSFLRHVC